MIRNKPDITRRKATEDETDGYINWEFNKKFTDTELKIWGHTVKQHHLDALNWKSVKWYSSTKKNENGELYTTIKSSNENYPIFVRECQIDKENSFLKFYEPLNYEKRFRFSTYPKGKEPGNYVNGLIELISEYKEFNREAKENFEAKEENIGKTFVNKKLPSVIIGSGERDSANCKAYGYSVVWLWNEKKLEKSVYFEIKKYVEKIYHIPICR